MAGNQNSGGMRPTAPQNNPANVSATGGNGQSGQANPNYTGFGYGQNGALQEQAGGAKMEKASSPAAGRMSPMASFGESLVALDAPSQDDLPVTDGAPIGPGRGTEALPNNLNPDRRQIENSELIKRYLPDLLNAARMDGAPDSYRRFVNYLKSQVI
jgi:hypothetical protein